MEINKNDISLEACKGAYRWSSMDPDKRGDQVQQDYFNHMSRIYSELMAKADGEAEREYLEAAAVRFNDGYLDKMRSWLAARSRCASSMVTGPANFNTRQNEKANSSEHNHYTEWQEWEKRALNAIQKGLNEMRNSAAGGPLVIMRQEVEAAEQLQEQYKSIRAGFRKEQDPQKRIEIVKAATGLSDEPLAAFVRQNYIDADGLPAFRLTNNLARIKAMRERLEQMEKRGNTPTTEKAFEGGIVRDNAEADRIQIIFNERPGPELYAKLKGRGFRWSPSANAWQRYRTNDTRYAVYAITGVKI